ncbi:MAG TPA: TIGR03435 family protein [Bryobacteraceae bacterium]|nr:TIGR03435 family protein [Bryobacteraceae bacterium]
MLVRCPLHLFAALAFASAASAQPPARPEFEVASVKPNASGGQGFSIQALPAGLQARNISLKRLIAMGYSVTDFQIFGELPWLESARFDVEAKTAVKTALPELRLMMQSLLDERFQLKFHRETRDLPILTLSFVKNGVKGPGLTDAPGEPCGPPVAPEKTAAGLPRALCGTVNPARGRIFGQRGRISQLCDRLSALLGRTVVDKTGLAGAYDIELTFAPDPAPGVPDSEPAGPSLFTAMREQLGLKLESGKGPVEVVVVDSAVRVEGN